MGCNVFTSVTAARPRRHVARRHRVAGVVRHVEDHRIGLGGRAAPWAKLNGVDDKLDVRSCPAWMKRSDALEVCPAPPLFFTSMRTLIGSWSVVNCACDGVIRGWRWRAHSASTVDERDRLAVRIAVFRAGQLHRRVVRGHRDQIAHGGAEELQRGGAGRQCHGATPDWVALYWFDANLIVVVAGLSTTVAPPVFWN
jgi:hypothetical protein